MTTLIASLIGFFSAAFPEFLKLVRDRADRKHELAILALQMESQKMGFSAKAQEIGAYADVAEMAVLHRSFAKNNIRFVEAISGLVRPIITFAFFALYAAVKYLTIAGLGVEAVLTTPWLFWSAEDQAIFAAIISFWFGSRTLQKYRGR